MLSNPTVRRSLLFAIGVVGVLAAACPAGAMPAATVTLAHPARGAARHTTTCRRHGKKIRCRRPARKKAKTQGARTTAAAPPAFSTLLGSTSAPSPSPAPPPAATSSPPIQSGSPPIQSNPPPLPVTVPSAWDRPALVNPTTIDLGATSNVLALSQSQDYILRCPSNPVQLSGALNVWGGHDVVIEDCDFEVSSADWAAHFSDQSGTLWVHDVHFGGPQLTGGVQMQEPGATVVLRDVLFDRVYGSQSTNHAELIQTWAGPARLLIDGLTGATTYQGLFLTPNQQYAGPPPTVVDLRHIDIDDTQGAYALWLGDVTGSPSGDASGAIAAWNVEDVYVDPNPTRTWPGWWLWPQPSSGDPTWDDATSGSPAGGPYVQATGSGATGVDDGAEPPALLGEAP